MYSVMPVSLVESQVKKKKSHKNRYKKTVNFKDLQKLSRRLKKNGKKIVFTTGSYDLLNPGHCRYLAEAKSAGDILVVGVAYDKSDKALKGVGYPLVDEDIRMELLSFLRCVDYVTGTDEDKPHGVLALLQPDTFYTSEGAWKNGQRDSQESYIVKLYGGKVVRRKRHEHYFGTQALVDHIANIRVIQILEDYLSDKVDSFHLDPVKHLSPADFREQKPNGKGAFDANDLVVDFEELENLGEMCRKRRRKIVFVSGSYDLLHVGHARFVEKAGILGDILVVGIPSDKSLRVLKGVGRPVITERSRAYVLGHLDCVNHIVIFDDSSVLSSLEKLKPDIFFTVAEEWNSGYKSSPEYKLVKSYGGDVVVATRQAPGVSASAIIDRMAAKKVQEIFRDCMREEVYKKVVGI